MMELMNKAEMARLLDAGHLERKLLPKISPSAKDWETAPKEDPIREDIFLYRSSAPKESLKLVCIVTYWRGDRRVTQHFHTPYNAVDAAQSLRTCGNPPTHGPFVQLFGCVSELPPEPGEGYHFLDPKTGVVPGDEHYSSGKWEINHSMVGPMPGDTLVWRRRTHTPAEKIQPPTNEDYWVHLGPEEIIRVGDEVFGSLIDERPNTWNPAQNIGGKPTDFGLPYRRYLGPSMVDPGPGYRILRPHEHVTDGDEYHWCGRWRTTCRPGHTPRPDRSYRRAVS